MRVFIFVVLVFAGTTTLQAQSVTEAKFVLRDITQWLPGTYDNAAQRFVESAFGAGEEGNHPWVHLVVNEEQASDLGEAVFRVTQSNRGDAAGSKQVYLLAFSVDEVMRAVRMTAHDVDGPPHDRCTVFWRQGPAHVYGSCTQSEKAGKQQEFKLTDGQFWRLDENRKDKVPMRFTKVRWYECFALVHHAEQGETTLKNPFTMHDGGDVFEFETEEDSPRKIEVQLRRSMWTSRSGKNFVPLLQLNVFERGVTDEPIANAWSGADSGRVGLAARGVGSARCKISTDAGKPE